MKALLKMGEEKKLLKGVYMDKELNTLTRLELKLQLVSHDYVLKTNKLVGVTEVVISLENLTTLTT